MTSNPVPENLLAALRGGHRFLITSHTNPDGDAIGSEIGLSRVLRSLGKATTIWNHDATPSLFEPLRGTSLIHSGQDRPAGFPDTFDAVVVLECPTLSRCGLEEALGGLPVLNIDHHLGNGLYGAVNWIDSAAPAVGVMVLRLAKALRATVDEDTATALYLALVSDTGGFRHANTTPEAFDSGAALVREGAKPDLVAQWLYQNRSLRALALLREMLGSLQLHSGDRVATALLTREMFERTGASERDTEDLIEYPRSIGSVEAVALLRQTGEDAFKVSLRSRGRVDVERIARSRGGGGHRNAAGFVATGTGDEIRASIAAELGGSLEPQETP